MENQFFVCVYFDGEILTTTAGCIFECRKQVAMSFNKNISFDDIKERISKKFIDIVGKGSQTFLQVSSFDGSHKILRNRTCRR